nr:snRNA-activating protein complex subunit 4-like [Rhipicephalus microplus]
MVPGRTHGQCRNRYIYHFDQQFVSGPFTSDEDRTLLQLVQKYGAGHWAMEERGMPWRAPNTLLKRYRRLCETLCTKEPTVADLERFLAVPVARMTAVRCASLTRMD